MTEDHDLTYDPYNLGPYNDPENNGVRLIGDTGYHEWDYDLFAVWRDETGAWFSGSDAGCSCDSPFDSATKEELDKHNNVHEVIDAFNAWAADDDWRVSETERVEFIERLLKEEYRDA